MSPRLLLEARDLTSDGLHGVSLSLKGGEACFLLGPPASGKSQLLRLLAGVRVPSEGRVRLAGADLEGLEVDRVARQVGFAADAPLLHGALRLRSALSHGASLRAGGSAAPARVELAVQRALESVGLSERAKTRIRRLTSAERLRARVALELLTEPKVLLIDAPAGASPAEEELVRELADREARAGRAVLGVGKEGAALKPGDRVVVLLSGYRVWDGALADALTHFDLDGPDQLLRALAKGEPRELAQRYRASSWQRGEG